MSKTILLFSLTGVHAYIIMSFLALYISDISLLNIKAAWILSPGSSIILIKKIFKVYVKSRQNIFFLALLFLLTIVSCMLTCSPLHKYFKYSSKSVMYVYFLIVVNTLIAVDSFKNT